jgi:hypothetical protein
MQSGQFHPDALREVLYRKTWATTYNLICSFQTISPCFVQTSFALELIHKLSLTCIRVVITSPRCSSGVTRENLPEVVEGQQMVSGGDVKDTSIAENGE